MNPFKSETKKIGLFVTAGYPLLDSTTKWIEQIQDKKFDFIEIGMPFSDPLADGPVIQKSSEVALKNGMNMRLLFEQISSIKDNIQLPIVLMGYLNPVFQFGMDNFLAKCEETGIQHVILPDMSVEIYERFYQTSFEKYNISNCFLITTQTPENILNKVKMYSSNSFVYLVSSNSTTGEKD
jgi:tryptophan synthase alpha chain